MVRLSHRIERSSLKVGDHIYTRRAVGIYDHHGLYVGNDRVTHFTKLGEGHGVLSTSLEGFLDGGKLRRYEYGVNPAIVVAKKGGTCTTAVSDDEDMVIHRANYLLENGFGSYNLWKNNCENFAIYCKTGLLIMGDDEGIAGLSGQVVSTVLKAALATTVLVPACFMASVAPFAALPMAAAGVTAIELCGPAIVAGTGGVAMYCIGRCGNDIGMRKDVKKVAVEDLEEEMKKSYPSRSNYNHWFAAMEFNRSTNNRNWTPHREFPSGHHHHHHPPTGIHHHHRF